MEQAKIIQQKWDVIVIGAGGAGLFCAATAARRGRSVLVLDHADKLGKKILISGGGRCNFTNIHANASTYFSQNEHFAKSALARFTPKDFLSLIEKYQIPYYEKKLGQMFCKESAQAIVDLLESECNEAGAQICLNAQIKEVLSCTEENFRFSIKSSQGDFFCESLVIATGGLSIPKIGATDFGHRLAKKFGLEVTPLDPALVSLTMDREWLKAFGDLSGVSVDCEVKVNKVKFRENILFTHTGLSGPSILQVSLYWNPGDEIEINLSPEVKLFEYLLQKKKESNKKDLKNILGEVFSDRLAEKFIEILKIPALPMAQMPDATLKALSQELHAWKMVPLTTGGYGKAEVTRGGVSTSELSSKTLEAKKVPGLFFIGEVVDVTGRLGGFNFQWAWASATAAGESA